MPESGLGSCRSQKLSTRKQGEGHNTLRWGVLEKATKRLGSQGVHLAINNHRPSDNDKIRTRMMSVVFWRKVPLQSMEAGIRGTQNCTTNQQRPQKHSRHGQEQRTRTLANASGTEPRDSMHTYKYCNSQRQCFISYFGYPFPSLPLAGHLLHCLSNWQEITADQWVLRVVGGYKLELASTPIQRSPPRVIKSKNSHLITEEVHQLLAKGTIRMVTPCQSQFLIRIFVVPKKDGVSQTRNQPETTEPVYDRDTFQDGDPGDNERPTETGRLDGFDRSLHTF